MDIEKIKQAIITAHRRCGQIIVSDAKLNITRNKSVNLGQLRAGLNYKIEGLRLKVGSNEEYAPMVEFGTGRHITNKDREMFLENIVLWATQKGVLDKMWHEVSKNKKNAKKSAASLTFKEKVEILYPLIQHIRLYGTKAKPFLRPAVEKNKNKILKILKEEIEKAFSDGGER